MPYPFAHPAAVLPLAPLLGPAGSPSALAIGSMIPDAWYFVPGLARADSHSAAGLLWFCLPLGLAAYLAFHHLLKQPLLALAPRSLACRLVAFAGRPKAPWPAVIASLLAGALSHLAWDSVAHSYALHGVHVLQHLSTVLGAAFLAWWCLRWLRRAPACPLPEHLEMSAPRRVVLIGLLTVLVGTCAWWSAEAPAVREALRQAWVAGMSALGTALFAFALLWKLRR